HARKFSTVASGASSHVKCLTPWRRYVPCRGISAGSRAALLAKGFHVGSVDNYAHQKSRRMLSMLLLKGSAVFGSGIATIFLRRSWSRDRYASRYHLASED